MSQSKIDLSRRAPELRAYDPTWRDWLAARLIGDDLSLSRRNLVGGLLGSIGLGKSGTGILDFTPAAIPFAAQEAWRARDPQEFALAVLPFGVGRSGAATVRGAAGEMTRASRMPSNRTPASPSGSSAPSRAADSQSAALPDLPRHYAQGDEPVIQPFPPTLQRPFEWDYPGRPPADASGRLTHDIDGRPLTATHVAGRRTAGGPDVPLTAADIEAVARMLTGNPIVSARPAQLPRGAIGGHFTLQDPTLKAGPDGYARQLAVSNALSPDKAELVRAHETGHAISDLTGLKNRARPPEGNIPHKGLERELKAIYDTGNNPFLNDPLVPAGSVKITPELLDYPKKEVPYEWLAEAIRAYLTNPNWIKNAAPETAKRIREFVNAHPEWSKIIQFNSVAGPAVAAAAMRPAAVSGEPKL